jgi:hypothetical protein
LFGDPGNIGQFDFKLWSVGPKACRVKIPKGTFRLANSDHLLSSFPIKRSFTFPTAPFSDL